MARNDPAPLLRSRRTDSGTFRIVSSPRQRSALNRESRSTSRAS
nr:hypothetical protein [Streptomyces antimycoticus]